MWAGVINIRQSYRLLSALVAIERLRGSAVSFCSFCSAFLFTHSSTEHGPSQCMGTSILALVSQHLSIVGAAFKTPVGTGLLSSSKKIYLYTVVEVMIPSLRTSIVVLYDLREAPYLSKELTALIG